MLDRRKFQKCFSPPQYKYNGKQHRSTTPNEELCNSHFFEYNERGVLCLSRMKKICTIEQHTEILPPEHTFCQSPRLSTGKKIPKVNKPTQKVSLEYLSVRKFAPKKLPTRKTTLEKVERRLRSKNF